LERAERRLCTHLPNHACRPAMSGAVFLLNTGAEFLIGPIKLRSAELSAAARRVGLLTAGTDALDGDCIPAAHAFLSVSPSDKVTVPKDNVTHVPKCINAQLRERITG